VDVNIRIVYDNEPLKEGLKSGWGFSCLIESERTILFDTGWDGALLLYNMKVLGVKPDKIDAVVLSHSHWDHIGGLPTLLNLNDRLHVYAPQSFSNHLKDEIAKRADLIEVSESEKLFGAIYTTGELGTEIKEQALILKGKEGSFIITGCAHPGLKEIVRFASNVGSVYGIVGVFTDLINSIC